ncbi:cysteine desulfurase [Pseudomonas sp. ABC1]|uniref:aminotransferase class V-fold PLP-dependent enzyme n=1 Tax=Pseudomonas sp. ABC1 TaxID=2748080 RepID=UPI0015C32709|nr:cysteine desulfurase [Pseudomonas sp. ABC1]QLF92174.1 cysteine desulfurase [Pseudomonas sp. ABC1]
MPSLASPWRQDFPGIVALQAEGQVYLDSAATAQKPQAMLDALLGHYSQGTANVHRAQHLPAERTTRAFEATRANVAQWLNARSSSEIVFTHGATEAFNLLAYALESRFEAGDEIVIGTFEHHANLLPWQQLARRRNLALRVLPLDAQGEIDLAQARTIIGAKTRLLAISQLSNVLGRQQPLEELLTLAKRNHALSVVDGAQGVVHARQDVRALGCDFYVFSSHKLYGPDGLGILYGREEALACLSPWQFGGEMLQETDYQNASFRAAPMGLEAGTPPIGAVIGFDATLRYLASLDPQQVQAHERQLHQHLLDGLQQYPRIHLLGTPDTALASFTVEGIHPADLAHLLGEQGIAIRSGSHCAMPLVRSLGHEGALRVSLALYNDGHDLQRFFEALEQALELLL